MKRWIVSGLAVAAIAVAVAWAMGWLGGDDKPENQLRTTPVDRGTIAARVTATGVVSALVTVQVGSQVSGRISELHADFNSNVKKGQVIGRIDPQMFNAAIEMARANHTAAQGNLAKARVVAQEARRQFERQRALMDRDLIARAELDTAEANALAAEAGVAAAQGSIEQARAALRQAEINLAYTTIVSPIDGVVISRNVDVGQTVAASLQAPTIFTIAEDLTRMQVDTNIAEADVGKLAPGMEATFTVDAFPSQPFKGSIRQIRNAATTLQNVVTYDAVIDVENPELKLRPGMTANVTVTYAKVEDVLRLPNAALRFRPPEDWVKPAATPGSGKAAAAPGSGKASAGRPAREGAQTARPATRPSAGERQIWVLRDGAPVQVIVTPGLTDGSFTELAGGDVREDDQVITEVMASGTSRSSRSSGGPGQPGRMPRMF